MKLLKRVVSMFGFVFVALVLMVCLFIGTVWWFWEEFNKEFFNKRL